MTEPGDAHDPDRASRMVALYETREELEKLFSERFMLEFTSFANFEEFTFSGAVFVNWQAGFIVGDRTAFDCCVQGKTCFKTWDEMYRKAVEFGKLRDGASTHAEL